jgi:hypothetical protein
MVARCLGPESCDGEARVEFQARARRFACVFDTIQIGQYGGEAKLRHGCIRTEFDRPVQAFQRFLVATQVELGCSGDIQPSRRALVARTDAQGFENVRLGLFAAAGTQLSEADKYVGAGQIPVDRQGALARGDALHGAIAVGSQCPGRAMRVCGIRPEFESFVDVGFGGEQSPAGVLGKPAPDKRQVDPGAGDGRIDIVSVEFDCAIIVKTRTLENGDSATPPHVRLSEEIVIHRIRIRRALGATGFGACEFLPEPVGEAGHDFVLHLEEIGDRLIEALGPDMTGRFGFKELDIDAHPVAAALHAAFEHVAHVEFAADLPDIGGLAFVGERCAASDDNGASDPRQVCGQTIHHAVDKILLLRIAADVGER